MVKKNFILRISVFFLFFWVLRSAPCFALTISEYENVAIIQNEFLDNPLKVKFYKNKLFVLDGLKNLIWKFNISDNKFIEEESYSFTDKNAKNRIISFTILEDKILALDSFQKQIIVLELKNGKKSTISIPKNLKPVNIETINGAPVVSDSASGNVYLFLNNSIKAVTEQIKMDAPYGLLSKSDQILYISDFFNNTIIKYDLNTQTHTNISKFGAWEGRLFYPKGLSGTENELLVSDTYLGVVTVFSKNDGSYLGTIGSNNKPYIFSHPLSISYSSENNFLAVADTLENKVFILKNTKRTLTTDDPHRVNILKLKYAKSNALKNICFQCHDTSAMDTVQIFSKKNQHPVDVKASNNPNIKMSNKVHTTNGMISCGSCHFPHSTAKGRAFFRFPDLIEDSKWCSECHKFSEKHKQHSINVPLKDKTLVKHLLNNGSKLGKMDSIICETCHNTHFAKNNKLLNLTADSSKICFFCHKDRHYKKGINHPVEANIIKNDRGCFNCHSIHQGKPGTKDLLPLTNEQNLCVRCHLNKTALFGSAHDINNWNASYKNSMQLKPNVSNDCLTCHSTHNAVSKENILSRTPLQKISMNLDVISQQCLSCHSGKNKKPIKYYTHSTPLPFTKIIKTNIEIELFSKEGKRVKKENVAFLGCTTCHDPHNGNKTDGGSAFVRNYKDLSIFCSGCHRDEGLTRYKYFHTNTYRQ